MIEFDENNSTLVIKTRLLSKTMTWNIRLERVVSPSGDTAERCEALEKLVEQLAARMKQLEQNASGQLNQRTKEDQSGVGRKIPRLQFEAVTTPILL